MDIASLVEIVVAVVVVYFFIKFIVSPILKLIVGIVLLLVLIYLLQRFFGFNIDNILAPFGMSSSFKNLALNMNWLLDPINYYINKITFFIDFIWDNFAKSTKIK